MTSTPQNERQERDARQQRIPQRKILTSKGLEAVEIEGVGLEELDPGASDGRGELLGDGVHRVPQARHPQAVVRVHPPR